MEWGEANKEILKSGGTVKAYYSVVLYDAVDSYERYRTDFDNKAEAVKYMHGMHQRGVDVDFEKHYLYTEPNWRV